MPTNKKSGEPKRTSKTRSAKKLKAQQNEVASTPPNGTTIPPVQQHVGVYASGNRFFKNADEAILTSRENAYRMWYDLDIQDPLQSRILAAAQLPLSIEPEDNNDQRQVERAQEVQRIVEDIPGLLKLKIALLNAIWFGKYGVQIDYAPGRDRQGRKVLTVRGWSPVHGDSIVFKWDRPGEVGVLVGPNSSPGEGTVDLTTEPTELGMAHVLTPRERESFVIHTHLHLASEFLKPQKAGTVTGVGLRDVVYFTWYLKSETMALLQEYLERVGLGITIYYYEQGNAQSEEAVRRLAESQTANCQIFWPRPVGSVDGAAGIERIEPSPVGVANFMEVIREYFGAQLRRMLIGQSMTSEAHTSGLGSGLAEVHENTFMRLVALDAVNLEETLTRELVAVIHRYSYPEDDFKLKVKIAVDKPDPLKYLEAARQFWDMGGNLDEDEVRGVLGFTRPEPDSAVLSDGGNVVEAVESEEQDEPTENVVEVTDEAADEKSPEVADVAAGEHSQAGVELQDTALNGAQVASLLDICDKVAAKQYPQEAAVEIIRLSFPLMAEESIRTIVSTLSKYKAPQPAPDEASLENSFTAPGGANTFVPGTEDRKKKKS